MAPASDILDRRPKTAREARRRKSKSSQASDEGTSGSGDRAATRKYPLSDEGISVESFGTVTRDGSDQGQAANAILRVDPGQVAKAAETDFHKHRAGIGTLERPVRALKQVEWNGIPDHNMGFNVGWRGDQKHVPTCLMPEDLRSMGMALRKPPKFEARSVTKSDFRAPKVDHVEEAHRHKDHVHAGEMMKGRRFFTDITRHTEMRDGSGLVGMGAWRATNLLEYEEEAEEEGDYEDEDEIERREKEKRRVIREIMGEAVLKMPKDHKNARPVVGTRSEVLKNYKPPMRRSSSVADAKDDRFKDGTASVVSRSSSASALSKESRRSRSSSHAGKEGKRRQKGNRRPASAGGGSSNASEPSLASEVRERLAKRQNANRFKGFSTQQVAYRPPPIKAYQQVLPYH